MIFYKVLQWYLSFCLNILLDYWLNTFWLKDSWARQWHQVIWKPSLSRILIYHMIKVWEEQNHCMWRLYFTVSFIVLNINTFVDIMLTNICFAWVYGSCISRMLNRKNDSPQRFFKHLDNRRMSLNDEMTNPWSLSRPCWSLYPLSGPYWLAYFSSVLQRK